jgi:hypothetical protein
MKPAEQAAVLTNREAQGAVAMSPALAARVNVDCVVPALDVLRWRAASS